MKINSNRFIFPFLLADRCSKEFFCGYVQVIGCHPPPQHFCPFGARGHQHIHLDIPKIICQITPSCICLGQLHKGCLSNKSLSGGLRSLPMMNLGMF